MSLPLFLQTPKKKCRGAGHLQSHGEVAEGAHPCTTADGGSGSVLERRKTGLEKPTGLGMYLHKSSPGRKMKNNGLFKAELAT